MINFERHKIDYLKKRSQFFIFNKDGKVLKSCNSLMDISGEIGRLNIYEFFPFFQSIQHEADQLPIEADLNYDCIGMEFNGVQEVFDVYIKHFSEGKFVCAIENRFEKNKYWFKVQQERNQLSIDKDLLAKQARIIAEQNEFITDSIDYAETIQSAILPSELAIKRLLPKSFVFYQPKDILSGDFYWVGEMSGKVIFTTSDSTGHGVPGALLSMLGISLFNEAVLLKKITIPSKILERVRNRIIYSLDQSKNSERPFEGMDSALVCLNKDGTLQFAGALSNLVVVRHKNKPALDIHNCTTGENEVINPAMISDNFNLFEIKGDRFPLSQSYRQISDFTDKEFQTSEGDVLYTFTDGLRDQFGGPSDKKFSKKRLFQMLLDIQNMNLEDQKKTIESAFHIWKGNREQIDDVCVMGVRV